jgi:hypothetical protein
VKKCSNERDEVEDLLALEKGDDNEAYSHGRRDGPSFDGNYFRGECLGLRSRCGSRWLCWKTRRGGRAATRGAACRRHAPLLHASGRSRLPVSRFAAHVRRRR